MTWTLDRTTNVGRVRVLVTGEAAEASSVLADEDLEVLLAISTDPLLAAALGLERIAGDQVLLLRKIEVGSIKLDGPAVSKAFLDLAARYRESWASYGAGDGDILIVPWVLNEQGWADAVWADVLRSGL